MKHFSHQDGVSDAQEAYPTVEPLEPENTTYSGIGAELYAARLRAGLELADVSQRLRIRLQHLESIERGAFDEIPGRIYAIGFLRTYSEFLGFNGDDIVNRFKAETGGGAGPTKLVFPSPAPESRMPGTAIILVALILAGGAYGAWYYMHDIQRIATELVSEVPERLTAESDTTASSNVFASSATETDTPAPAVPMTQETTPSVTAMTEPETAETGSEPMAASEPVQAVEPAQTEPEPETAVDQPAQPDNPAPSPQPAPSAAEEPDTATTETMTATATPTGTPEQMEPATERMAALPTPSEPVATREPAPATASNQANDSVSEAASQAPVTVEQAPPPPPTAPASQAFGDSNAPQEYGIGNTDARVVLRARYDCWVQVRGANDEQFLTKVLRAGDTYHVPNRTDVRLYASDAGALEVLVDGRPIPPIGGPGEIVRDISLEAGILLNRG